MKKLFFLCKCCTGRCYLPLDFPYRNYQWKSAGYHFHSPSSAHPMEIVADSHVSHMVNNKIMIIIRQFIRRRNMSESLQGRLATSNTNTWVATGQGNRYVLSRLACDPVGYLWYPWEPWKPDGVLLYTPC